MNVGRREGRATRRWLPLAALATVALVAALWAGLGRDTSEPHATEVAAHEAAAVLPEGTARADAPRLSPLDAPPPTSLSSGRASLTIAIEDEGLLAAAPFLRVTRHPDGTTEMRSLGQQRSTAWPTMPAGRYTIESLNDTWIVTEPDITLAGGEIRTVTLSSRRTAAVRVAGAFSGKLQPASSVRLEASGRSEGSSFERGVEMASEDADVEGVFALFGLPATLADGSTVEKLRIVATVGRDRAESDWFAPDSLLTSPTIVVRAPEPILVGRVTREAAGDGLETNLSSISVALEALDAQPPPAPSPHLAGVHSPRMILGAGRSHARVDRDGRFELRLAQLPDGPVRVRASNGIDQPAEAGPFTLSAKSLPLQVDLRLGASGTVRGSVRTGVGAAGTRRIALHTLGIVTARRLEGGHVQGVRQSSSKVAGDEAVLSFLIGTLEPGEYEVAVNLLPASGLAQPPEARHLVKRVQVQTGQPATLEFDAFTPSGLATLRGSVVLPAGLEAEAVELRLARAGELGGLRTAGLGPDGRFAFADVPPGDWVVRAAQSRQSLSSFFGSLGNSSNSVAGGRCAVRVEHADVLLPPLDLTRPEVRLHSRSARHLFISDADKEIYHCTVGEDGVGRIYGLPAGRYSVLAGQKESRDPIAFDVGTGDALVTVEVP